MRSSTLLAGLFALLIVAGVSFGAGYYVASEKSNESPNTRTVAALDTGNDDATSERDPLEMPKAADRDREEPATPAPEASGQPDITPKPATDAPAEADASNPGETGEAATPSTNPSKDPPDSLGDLKDRLAELGGDSEDFESIFNGPKVDFTATIGGQVLDALGVPVASADVHAVFSENYSADEGGRTVRLLMGGSEYKGKSIATTDGGGYWTATINRQVSEKASLDVGLTASAQGYADSTKQTVTLRNEDTRDGIKLVLRGAGSVSGRVIDAHGMGVEGVTVSLRSGDGNMFGGDEIEIEFGGGTGKHSATTDGAGEFLIEGVPEGRYKFKLNGIGYRQISGPTEIDVKSGQAHRAAADFTVATTGSVVARFNDLEGNPVRGWATLTLKDESGKTVKRLSASLGTNGVFEKNDPSVGNFQVEVRVHGYKTRTVQADFVEGQRYDFGTLTLEKDEDGGNSSRIWLPEIDE